MSDPSDADKRKQINSLRFSWFEQVIRDVEFRRSPVVLRLAAYVMQRFDVGRGYAEFSNDSAAREFRVSRQSIIRAKARLIGRGWLRLKSRPQSQRSGWQGSRFTLSWRDDDPILEPVVAPDT